MVKNDAIKKIFKKEVRNRKNEKNGRCGVQMSLLGFRIFSQKIKKKGGFK